MSSENEHSCAVLCNMTPTRCFQELASDTPPPPAARQGGGGGLGDQWLALID